MSVQGPLTQPWHLGAYCLVCGAPYAETASGRPADLGRTVTVWDKVFDALGRPGKLGASKAESARAEVERILAESDRVSRKDER